MKKKVLIQLIGFMFVGKILAFDFSGVWLINRWVLSPTDSVSETFSWGKEYVPRNTDLAIDESSKLIKIYGIGIFDIKDIVQESESEYLLSFYFDRGNFDVEYKITLLNEKEFVIENLTRNTQFISDGDRYHYYRISGPQWVEKNNEAIYAIYIGGISKKNTLKENEMIQLIGIRFVNKNTDNTYRKEYWYITENKEYGYVDEKLIKIIFK